MNATDNGAALRAAFAAYVATLPAPMQQNINEANARGESFTAKAFASGYVAGSARGAITEANIRAFLGEWTIGSGTIAEFEDAASKLVAALGVTN